MSDAREAAKKGLGLSVAAVGHARGWFRWQTDRHACREVARLGPPPLRTADAERRAA
jgi:hypothetical protein